MNARHSRERRRYAVVRALASVALAGLLAVGLTGCSSEAPIAANAPPPAPAEERTVFVALGGDETLNRGLADGFRTSWTRRVFAALPHSGVYVNLASEDATTATGNTVQTQRALDLQPTLATVWFGAGDTRVRASDAAFRADLTNIATRLRDKGVRVLLLANANDRSESGHLSLTKQVAEQTGAVFVEVPGPTGNPRDASVQEAVATAVLARVKN